MTGGTKVVVINGHFPKLEDMPSVPDVTQTAPRPALDLIDTTPMPPLDLKMMP